MSVSELRFVTSADGTRLAVRKVGTGPLLVLARGHDFYDPEYSALTAHWTVALAASHSLVRYDVRGTGLSDRDVKRFSLDAWVEDFEAVVNANGSVPVDVVAVTHGAAVAVAYAAKRPDRVRRLVICGGYARGRLQRNRTPEQLRETSLLNRSIKMGWGENTDYAMQFRLVTYSRMFPDLPTPLIRECDRGYLSLPGPSAIASVRAVQRLDVREDAKRVTCATLVCHSRENRYVPFEEGRLLASLIPEAKFVTLHGGSAYPLADEPAWAQFLAELHAFFRTEDASTGGIRKPIDIVPNLTARQREVLRLVARGQTDKQIGRVLNLSPRTVEMHVARAVEALRCRTRTDAVRLATELRLLE